MLRNIAGLKRSARLRSEHAFTQDDKSHGSFRVRLTGSWAPVQAKYPGTLWLRIKTLEEKNRELTALLELAYGKLALFLLHGPNVQYDCRVVYCCENKSVFKRP
jgi:hypothetical protein